MDFQFQDPERGFDRARVKGVVARLVRVKDASATTALEVAAGGKLYQVGEQCRPHSALPVQAQMVACF